MRLFIADDHRIFAQSLASFLGNEPNITIVGTAENGVKALQQLEIEDVDILLTDMQMPNMDGIALTLRVHENFPTVKVLMLSMIEDSALIESAIQVGIDGYLLKTVDNFHGKRASSIVKGMLEHSRTSTGVKELTDINKLADEYLRLSYHGIRAKDSNFNSDYKTEFDENLPKIEVIPQDMGRVLLNLINNAFWAVKTVEKPLVTVKTEQSGSQLIIKVSDNGTGMSEDVKAKIFQPFFTTKPTGQGTGLGLSLAYDIITKGHGGTIKCESTEGISSEFTITLHL